MAGQARIERLVEIGECGDSGLSAIVLKRMTRLVVFGHSNRQRPFMSLGERRAMRPSCLNQKRRNCDSPCSAPFTDDVTQ